MKKIVVILAAFVLALFVVSCGGDSGETDTNPTDEPTNPTDEPTNPTEEPTNPTEEPTNPTDPTEEPTNPTDEPTNPTDEPTDPVAETCTEGDIRVGDTVCPDNPKGKLHQKCENGGWVDLETCVLCDPGDYPKVCGTYAQKMWFTSQSKIYSINAAEGWTRTYFLIVQEQEQDKVHIKATYCNIKIDNDASGLLQVIMPQSFADALGTADKESVLKKRDDGTVDFAQDVFWELRGIDPNCYGDNPAGYTLPDADHKDDPCIQDWDHDDMPGLTINASGTLAGTGATMNMVEKSSSTIHDGLVSPDGLQINALVDWTDEQNILWAPNDVLKSGSVNQQKNASKQAGFTGPFNFIEQFKIPEGSDCAYIVNNAATIFSPDPVTLK